MDTVTIPTQQLEITLEENAVVSDIKKANKSLEVFLKVLDKQEEII